MGNDQLNIRVATPEDAPALLEIYRPYVEETAISFEYHVPSQGEFAQRIAEVLEGHPYLVAECDGQVLGYTYARHLSVRKSYSWSVETSIYVKQHLRKKGVGRALYASLEAVLRQMGVTNMYARIAYPPNGVDDQYVTTNSLGFHEHLGFAKAGHFKQCAHKFGRWYDVVWAERCIGEHSAEMPSVVSFPQIASQVPSILAQA